MAGPIGSLVVKIGADVGGLHRGGQKAGGIMDNLSVKARSAAPALAAMGAAAAAAAVALGAKLAKDGLAAVDSQAKLARQLGGTIDGLKSLQIAAGDAGVSSSTLSTAMEKLNARIGEAMRGTGTAYLSFQRLGLSAQQLSQLDVDQRMAMIADRMQEMGLSTQQAGDELRQMGIRNGEIINLMRQGGDAIRAARDEVNDFGLSLSEVDAAQVEAANDAMSRISFAIEAISQRLAVKLAPALRYAAEWFQEVAKQNSSLTGAVDTVVDAMVEGYAFVADSLVAIQATFLKFNVFAAQADHAITKFAYSAARTIAELLDKHVTPKVNGIIEALNRLPGFDIPQLSLVKTVDDSLGQMVISTHNAVAEAKKALMDLALVETPGDAARKQLEAYRKAAEEAAGGGTEINAPTLGGGGGKKGGKGGGKDKETELEKHRAHLAQKLAALQDYAASETELETLRHNERLANLQAALEQELLTEGQARRLREELTAKHEKKIGEIRKKGASDVQKFQAQSFQKQAQQITGALTQITAVAANENRKMFRAQKAFAIVQALINTSLGVTQALAAYPPPVSFVMAAAQLAAGISSIAAIKSQSFSGGGGGGGGAAPSAPAATPAAGAAAAGGGGGGGGEGGGSQIAEINLVGDIFSRGQIVSLIDGINEATADGARLVIR